MLMFTVSMFGATSPSMYDLNGSAIPPTTGLFPDATFQALAVPNPLKPKSREDATVTCEMPNSPMKRWTAARKLAVLDHSDQDRISACERVLCPMCSGEMNARARSMMSEWFRAQPPASLLEHSAM